jgi:hypothetical protein
MCLHQVVPEFLASSEERMHWTGMHWTGKPRTGCAGQEGDALDRDALDRQAKACLSSAFPETRQDHCRPDLVEADRISRGSQARKPFNG